MKLSDFYVEFKEKARKPRPRVIPRREMWQGMTARELGAKYGINYNTVATRYNRGWRGEDLVKPPVFPGSRKEELS